MSSNARSGLTWLLMGAAVLVALLIVGPLLMRAMPHHGRRMMGQGMGPMMKRGELAEPSANELDEILDFVTRHASEPSNQDETR